MIIKSMNDVPKIVAQKSCKDEQKYEAEAPVLWPPHAKSWLIGKDSDAGRDWGQEENGTTEDEMAGWHHWLDGRESQWTPGVGDGHGGLACCDSWGGKERLIWSDLNRSRRYQQEVARIHRRTIQKNLHDPDNHNGVIAHLEPDILECKVKWALGSITMNKASGGDGIPGELFQILKDDAMKVLHSICQQIWKTQQWPQDWKRSVFIPIWKKGNAKECSCYCTIALISSARKVLLKILQPRLQRYMNQELPDVEAGFREGRGTRDQIASTHWIIEKAREFQKNIYFCFIDYAKAFECVNHNNLWEILQEMGIPDHLTCLLRNLYAGQEATVRTWHGTTDWFQIGKGVHQGCILSPCLFNLHAECIMWSAGLDEAQAGIKIAGRNINKLRYADDTILMTES